MKEPPQKAQAMRKMVIWLEPEQIDRLDVEVTARRRADGKGREHINRGTVIRDLIDTGLATKEGNK